jgi:hypothetical protein
VAGSMCVVVVVARFFLPLPLLLPRSLQLARRR